MCPRSPSSSPPDVAHNISSTSLPHPEVLRHVVDVHCHPTDTWPVSDEYLINDLQITVCAMSTRAFDQGLVHELASVHPKRVIPCFGPSSPSSLCMLAHDFILFSLPLLIFALSARVLVRLPPLVHPLDISSSGLLQRTTLSRAITEFKPLHDLQKGYRTRPRNCIC